MKVTQEKLPASQIGLEIEVTPEMSKKVYERVVQEFTRSANIPGFRKGKVPRQVLIQRIGATRIKAAAVEELVEDGLKEAVKQENIDVLGNYQLRSPFEELVNRFEPGQSLTFSASVDVQPEVTLKQYINFQLQAEEVKPDPERVEKVLQNYQDQLATLVPVEGRPAQMKDVAVVDFKGVLPSEDPEQEPEEVPGGQAEDFQLELLEGRFIEGFIDGIVGMNPGDTKEVEATFPDTYPQPKVAGRKALFTITLKELKEKELPELDDEFAQEVSEFQTITELRESLKSRFAKEAEDQTRSNKEQAILKELLNQIEVEVPETLIEREINFMLQQTAMQLQNQGIDVKQFFTQDMVARLREQSRPEAISRIKQTLALGEIAKRESIEATEEEISTKANELLENLGESGANIDRDRLRSVVAEDVLKEKIMDWLIEHSQIELVPEGTLTKAEEAEATEAIEEGTTQSQPLQEILAEAQTMEVEATEVVSEEPSPTKVEPITESTEVEPVSKKKRTPKSATTKEPLAEEVPHPSEAKEHSPEVEATPKTRKTTKKKTSAE
ncbi:trigger factor [Leptolyngbyaceae cyanobacterium JSC-12]|nr:trigger factor [Leptolyngbyaceae cyanobacterium JSC-12]